MGIVVYELDPDAIGVHECQGIITPSVPPLYLAIAKRWHIAPSRNAPVPLPHGGSHPVSGPTVWV